MADTRLVFHVEASICGLVSQTHPAGGLSSCRRGPAWQQPWAERSEGCPAECDLVSCPGEKGLPQTLVPGVGSVWTPQMPGAGPASAPQAGKADVSVTCSLSRLLPAPWPQRSPHAFWLEPVSLGPPGARALVRSTHFPEGHGLTPFHPDGPASAPGPRTGARSRDETPGTAGALAIMAGSPPATVGCSPQCLRQSGKVTRPYTGTAGRVQLRGHSRGSSDQKDAGVVSVTEKSTRPGSV